MIAGTLELQLMANVARLANDMRDAKNSVNGAMGNINSALGATQKLLLGLGVGVSFSALFGQVEKSIDMLGKLDDMAQKTGSSVENLSKLQKVASQYGADFSAVDVALGKLAKGLAGVDDAGGKTAKALSAIGISQQFVKTHDPSEVMIQIAKKLQDYKDGASKAALATDLFGKAGIELLPYLNDMAGGVDKFTGSSKESTARAAKLQDDLGLLKTKFNELASEVTIGILPTLDSFITKLNAILQFKSIFSSVGGIDAKDYDKEIALREAKLQSAIHMKAGLEKPTLANKINDVVFGDIGDLERGITVYKDEIKALKDLKIARDALKASPTLSPNQDGKDLKYAGAEAEAKLQSERMANQKLLDAARKKSDADQLKMQNEFADMTNKYLQINQKEESKILDAKAKAKEKQIKEFADMDAKYLKLSNDTENKALDEKYKKEKDALEKQRKLQEDLAKDINKSLTDALLRGFESGKSFAQNFIDTLKNMFKTLVLQPVISFILSPVSGAISAALGGILGGTGTAQAATSAAGATGNSSFMSSASNLFSMISKGNAGIVGGIESIGASIANGMGGIRDSIGGYLGANASFVAKALSYSGAVLQLAQGNWAGAAGTAIGTYFGGPIGGAIGSFLGGAIGGMFGGTPKLPRYYTAVTSTSIGGKFTSGIGKTGSDSKGIIPGTEGTLNALMQSFSGSLVGLLEAAGKEADLKMTAVIYKKNNSFGYLNYTLNQDKKVSIVEQGGEDVNATFKALINNVLGAGLIKAIKNSSLEEGVKSLFDGILNGVKAADKVAVTNSLVQATIGLYKSQEQLADRFGLTVDQAARAAKATGAVGVELVNFVNKLASVSIGFKTQSQSILELKSNMLDVIKASVGAFKSDPVTTSSMKWVQNQANINLGPFRNKMLDFHYVMTETTSYIWHFVSSMEALPKNLLEYDNALKTINTTTSEGALRFKTMFDMRDQFIAFTQAMETLRMGIDSVVYELSTPTEQLSDTQSRLAALFGSLNLSVPQNDAAFKAMAQTIDINTEAGLNLAAALPTLYAAYNATQDKLQSQIDSTKQSFDALVSSLNGVSTDKFTSMIDYINYQSLGRNFGKEYADASISGRANQYTPIQQQSNQLMNNLTNQAENQRVVAEAIKTMQEKLNAALVAIEKNTYTTASLADKDDKIGTPPVRTA